MRTIALFLAIIFCSLTNAHAQSILIGPLPGTSFCTGDKVVIPYTASGSFTSKNSFIVQISDKTGSFDKFFYNAGEVRRPSSGEVTITIPELEPSASYRLRVISSDPYLVSSNISPTTALGPQPDLNLGLSSYRPKFAMIGEPLTLASPATNTNVTWDFGLDANPRISSDKNPSVIYSTPGFKSITFTASSFGGCSKSQTFDDKQIYIGTCNPSIPKTAVVDSVSNFSGHGYSDIWVVPGGYLDLSIDGPVVYAEAGSTINRTWEGVYYLKAGASVLYARDGILIYEDGVGFGSFDAELSFKCPNLEFDYSDAPPYKINPSSVMREHGNTIQVYPNPATDRLTIEHKQTRIREVSVRNALGAEQLFLQPEGLGKTAVDLSRLAAGIYFLDLITDRGIETHKIAVTR